MPLVRHAPSSPVRNAEYAADADPRAELAVFRFDAGECGSVESNVARWLAQIEQPDRGDTARGAKRDEFKVGGLSVPQQIGDPLARRDLETGCSTNKRTRPARQ